LKSHQQVALSVPFTYLLEHQIHSDQKGKHFYARHLVRSMERVTGASWWSV